MTCRYSPYLTAALQAHSNGLPVTIHTHASYKILYSIC